MLWGNTTREHKALLNLDRESTDSQWLQGELAQIMLPWASRFFAFYAQNPHLTQFGE